MFGADPSVRWESVLREARHFAVDVCPSGVHRGLKLTRCFTRQSSCPDAPEAGAPILGKILRHRLRYGTRSVIPPPGPEGRKRMVSGCGTRIDPAKRVRPRFLRKSDRPVRVRASALETTLLPPATLPNAPDFRILELFVWPEPALFTFFNVQVPAAQQQGQNLRRHVHDFPLRSANVCAQMDCHTLISIIIIAFGSIRPLKTG